MTAGAVPAEAVRYAGTLTTHTAPGGTTGRFLHRRFCPRCGSPVVVEPAVAPRVVPMAGTLDDPGFVRPIAGVSCEEAQSWVTRAAVVLPRR